jgi:hypothetical protein
MNLSLNQFPEDGWVVPDSPSTTVDNAGVIKSFKS